MNLFGALFGGRHRRGYGLGHGFGLGSRRRASHGGYYAGGGGLLGLILTLLSVRRFFRNRSVGSHA
jgi:hypothetical protein